MTIHDLIFGTASFLHNLFTAIWMGGLIVTAISFLPALKESLGPGPQVKNVMTTFQKRQSVWVYISMAGLVLTGLMMSKHSAEFNALFSFGNPYSIMLSIKHILVIAMIGITLYRVLILGRNPSTPAREKLNKQLLFINVALAVSVLLTSGFVAALASPFSNG